jgi:hypothetical protein
MDSRGDRKLMDAFQRFLLGRNGDTLAGYVQVYPDDSAKYYGEPPSHHSSQIFFGTLSLAIAKGSAYYAYKVRSWIDAKGSPWNTRYLALDELQYRTPLRTQIENTIKAKGRLIDELKIAYYTKYQRDPDIAALRSFEPVPIPDQVKERLSNALSDVEVAVGARSVESFDKAFPAVAKVLDANQEWLALWVLVKHCRERATLNARFRHLIYLFGVGRLYLSAIRKYPVSHKDGLNAEEQAWLFDAGEKNDRYFDDFAAQISAAIWKRVVSAGSPSTRKWRDPAEDEPDDAYAAMARCEGMLQVHSDRLRLKLTPLGEAAALRGAVEEAWLKHAQQVNAMGITIDAGLAGVTTIRVGQTIGNFFVLWWDGHNRTVYLQVNGFDQVVFECDEGRLAEIYRNHSFYGVLAENTQHLLELIPFIWEILGFIPDLVSGGLLGLVKSIAFSYAFDKSMQALGIDPTKAQFFVLGASLLRHAARPRHASGSSAHREGAVETKALGREVHAPATERPAVDILGTERTGTRADPSATRGLAGGAHRDAPHDTDVAVRAADAPKARPGATRADERQAAPDITDSDRGIQQRKEGVAANANKPLGSNAPGITNAERAVPRGQHRAAPRRRNTPTSRNAGSCSFSRKRKHRRIASRRK